MPAKKSWYESPAIAVLMLVFIAPLGVALMWMYQKSWALKTKTIASVASLSVFALAALSNPGDKTAAQTTPQPVTIPTSSVPLAKEQSPVATTLPTNKPIAKVASAAASASPVPVKTSDEDKMKKVIQDYYGKRLRDVDVNKVSKKKGGGLEIYAQFNQSGWANWSVSDGTAKKQIEADMRDAYFKVFNSGLPVAKVTLANYSTVMDQFGKESEDITYETSLDKDTAQKIN